MFEKNPVLNLILHRRRGVPHGIFDFFHLTVPKKFVGKPFCVSKISGNDIFHAYEGRHHGFVDFLCPTVRKTFFSGTFVFQNYLPMEQIYGQEEGYQVLP